MHFSFEIDIEDPHELRPLSETYKICIFETYSSERQAPYCQNFLNIGMSINKQNVFSPFFRGYVFDKVEFMFLKLLFYHTGHAYVVANVGN